MDEFTHHWERQSQYKLNLFETAAISAMNSTIDQYHEENLLLAGMDVLWLSRKTTGTKCYYCWDRESQQSKYYKCSNCYGVGWLGGYDGPYELKMSFTPSKHQINIANLGLVIDVNPTAWTKKTTPPIKERDIIVVKNDMFGAVSGNIRFYVASSEESIISDNVRYQDLVLTYPGNSDPIWDISIAGVVGGTYYEIECALTVHPIHSDLECSLEVNNSWWVYLV